MQSGKNMLLVPQILNFDEILNSLIAGYKDPLTSCLNVRAWTEQRSHPPERRWAFYLDLDGLKTINDTKGHQFGDRFIRESTEALRSVFKRSDDLIFRIGGDEFVVLSNHIPSDMSSLFMFSIGIAEITDSLEEAIRSADVAMYQNKRSKKKTVNNNKYFPQYLLRSESHEITVKQNQPHTNTHH